MKKVAIIVGHSFMSQGAHNKRHDVTEFEYNKSVAQIIERTISGVECEIVYREGKYSQLPDTINNTNANIAISLHCNAFNTSASGTETLSSGSKNSMKLANIIQTQMAFLFKIHNRGVKVKKQTDRGGLVLHKTVMPCVLLEPFFIDNNSDLETGVVFIQEYAGIICKSIYSYFNLDK